MDAGEAFRQGLGSVNRAREARTPRVRESSHESEDPSPRIAHTLAACCRCRKRKTRCDPALPRCLPCERAGAVCEYYDTAKSRKISRTYVIRLQDRVRALQLELGRYIDEDGTEHDTEESIRPGGLVRLEDNDETPRYLGPSSGIAMTRLVMEEARRYTDSRSIRELVPEVSQRRTPVHSPGGQTGRKRSYPMRSAIPAERLPIPLVRDKLIGVFNQKAQYLFPTLHEPTFYKECKDVYAGDTDPYKNFVVRMVLAISMQKLDVQYAGLANSYYLAAMQNVDEVIRPKDIKTLQCLVLIAQYSLMTPTRTPIYYIVGLATRLCQQLGLSEEKTIVQGLAQGLVDPLQMDMRRRLSWIVLSMEMGLAHSLGRPNGFASSHDHVDIKFFHTIDDMHITPNGIMSQEPSEKKIMAVHFFKMRLLQAEIRRVLYQRKRPEPKNDQHPWFAQMEKKMRDWLEASPAQPAWSKPWFTGKLNTMLVFLYRPSPQVPKPSLHGARECHTASAYNIAMQHKQMDNPSIDITWIFLQSLFMAVNTLLWSLSYPGVRALHPKEEVQTLLDLGINVMESCTDRWPGSDSASGLYQRLGRACLKAYEGLPKFSDSSSPSANSPASAQDPTSPFSDYSQITTGAPPSVTYSHTQTSPEFEPQTFNFFFGTQQGFATSPIQNYVDTQQQPLPQPMAPPVFRSNSIFQAPSSRSADRRFSYFPPDVDGPQNLPNQQGMTPIPNFPGMPGMGPPRSNQAMQQQSMPPQWSHAVRFDETSPPLHTAPSMGSTGNAGMFNSPEETFYFIQPTYNFGPQMFGDVSWGGGNQNMGENQAQGQDMRMDSLSYDQQIELMDCLENEDLGDIDAMFGLTGEAFMFAGSGIR